MAVWMVLAIAPWLAIAPARRAIEFGPIQTRWGCRLGVAGSGPECACAALDPRTRLALGLPVALDALSERDFQTLAGIGPVRASAIEAERLRAGPFGSPEQLAARVPGIGPATAGRVAGQLAGQAGAACDTSTRR